MRSRRVRTWVAGLPLAGCGPAALAQSQIEATADAAGTTIEGVGSYREWIALPPGAVFEATIEDVSPANALSAVIGKTVIDDPMSPIRFRIPFDPAGIAPERSYAVRAWISVEGQLRVTSDPIHTVLTRDPKRQRRHPCQHPSRRMACACLGSSLSLKMRPAMTSPAAMLSLLSPLLGQRAAWPSTNRPSQDEVVSDE